MAQEGGQVRIAVDEECDQQGKWGKHCIYKLPACITDLKKSAYKPRTISFGPYHHGNPKLRPMECHKSRVLNVFLKRSGKIMDDCIRELSRVTEEVMDAYSTLDRKWKNREEFLKMMITDGFFMLEVMAYFRHSGNFQEHYDENKDPIFSDHAKTYMLPYIKRDMLMLENQLPISFLIHLLSLGGHLNPNGEKDDEYIINLITNFCSPFFNQKIPKHDQLKDCKHALHIHRQLLISGTTDEPISEHGRRSWWSRWHQKLVKYYYVRPELPSTTDHDWKMKIQQYGPNIIPSATRLRDASITIRKSDTQSIESINFYVGRLVGGLLEIPHIAVDDATEPVFLNLMAFERLHPKLGCEVSSYVAFMDDIIDDVQDVKILQKNEIISNAYRSDMAVANLFNSLTKDTTVDRSSVLFRVRYQVRKHCKGTGHGNKLLGDLRKNYLNNRWAYFVVVAAFLTFGIATTGTIYTALEYYKKDAGTPSPSTNSTSLS